MSTKRIYCDYNATTPVLPDIQKNYSKILETYGNPSSLYHSGRIAKEALEQARYQIADAIHATPDQIIFTSSGTEANNHVLQQFMYLKNIQKEPVHMLISAIEHSSVNATIHYMKEYGIEIDTIPVHTNGTIDIETYKTLFKPHTKLVSIMTANNEIGTIQPIEQCCEIAHSHGALCHTDAVQALGKMNLDVNQSNVDFLSCSSHKVNAPKGSGVLYIKDQTSFRPLIYGGHHERGLRASTENIPTIIAFGQAVSQLNPTQFQQHTQALKTQFKTTFRHNPKVTFNDPTDVPTLSNTINMTCHGCNGQALAMNCDLEGIDVSTGSACSVGSIEPSHVLTAIGLTNEANLSSLRISFGPHNTSKEIETLCQTLHDIMDRLTK